MTTKNTLVCLFLALVFIGLGRARTGDKEENRAGSPLDIWEREK
jgi:hypothetical protein